MISHREKLQRVGSLTLGLMAVALLTLGLFWPASVAELLRSRLAVLLFGVWSSGFAFWLHPELRVGFVRTVGEFRKATDQVAREIRGDDDDGPS